MNELFQDFAKAHSAQQGYILAQTLSPVATAAEPQKLNAIWRSTNAHSVKGDIRHFIKTTTSHRGGLTHDELSGWVDVYVAYWHAIGEIVSGESGRVRVFYCLIKPICY